MHEWKDVKRLQLQYISVKTVETSLFLPSNLVWLNGGRLGCRLAGMQEQQERLHFRKEQGSVGSVKLLHHRVIDVLFVLHCNGSRRFEGSTRKLYLRRLRHRRWCAQFEFGSSIFLLFLVAADFWLKGKDSMWGLSLLRYPRTFGFVLKWDDKAWNRTEWRIAQPKITGWISWLLRLEKVSSSTKRRRRSTSWFEMRLVCTWPVGFIRITSGFSHLFFEQPRLPGDW